MVAGPDGEDVIAIRSVCYLPLTYDHRLVDGADAGRFVTAIRERLEEGAFEADLGLLHWPRADHAAAHSPGVRPPNGPPNIAPDDQPTPPLH